MCCSSNSGYFLSPMNYYNGCNPYNYNCYYTPNCGCNNNGGLFGLNGGGCNSSLGLIALFALLCR